MLNINDKEYREEDLTDDQKHLVNQINSCRQQAAGLNSQLQVYQTAENAFVATLIASVEESLEPVPPTKI